jgi:hypothetical protein
MLTICNKISAMIPEKSNPLIGATNRLMGRKIGRVSALSTPLMGVLGLTQLKMACSKMA